MQRNVVGVQSPSHVGIFATPWTTACQASLCYKGLKRNDKGLKNCVHAQLGQIMNSKTQKTKHPAATSEELGAKAGCCPCPLHTPPPKGWANHLSHPSPPHIKGINSPPSSGSEQGNCYLLSLPPIATGAPIKPCLNFLSGLLSISIDQGGRRTLINNKATDC